MHVAWAELIGVEVQGGIEGLVDGQPIQIAQERVRTATTEARASRSASLHW
jgi:hypothetical protein